MSDEPGIGNGATRDKRALLSSLRMQRTVADGRGRHRRLAWLATVVAIVSGAFIVVGSLQRGSVAPSYTSEPETVAAAVVDAGEPEPIEIGPSAGMVSVLDAAGYVVARRQATVSSKVTGKVTEVLIEEGMSVESGQLLARLDANIPAAELALAEARLQMFEAALPELAVGKEQARLDLDRVEDLAARGLVSQAEFDRIRLALERVHTQLARAQREVDVARRDVDLRRRQLEDMEIRAPFAGIVVARTAQPGEMVSPISAGGGFTRTGICSIVDMGSLEVEVDVNEAYIQRIRPQQSVSVQLNASPEDPIPASVIAVIPTADRNRSTVRVPVRLLESDERVLPDMGVRVSFLADSAEQ